MQWVAEYIRCEQACRDLARILTRPDDKRALELMANGWAARAAERKTTLERAIWNGRGASTPYSASAAPKSPRAPTTWVGSSHDISAWTGQ